MKVRPKPIGAPAGSLKLTPEEDFVLSRIDGSLSVRDLVALTGIEQARVEQIVTKLATSGAVQLEAAESSGYLPDEPSSPALPSPPSSQRGYAQSRPRQRAAQPLPPPPEEGTASLADFAAALGMDPSTFAAAQATRAAVERKVDEARVETKSGFPPPREAEAEGGGAGDVSGEHPMDELIEIGPGDAPDEELPELEEVVDEGGEGDALYDDEEEAVPEEDAESAAVAERNYRQLYAQKFQGVTMDARVAAAKVVSGAELMALCFDPDPRIVSAILENPKHGLDHVRLIAQHHRTGTGLEMISRRTEYLRDILTERRLLRNPQAGDTVIGRIMASKRVFPTYKIAIDRDVPELTRVKARGFLRKKFQMAPSEERADLIVRTEGRCLILMTGCTFDARCTAILCGRPYNSVLFIQNLAKFPACPPALLGHLLKQPFVRKNMPLKKLILQHPNVPGEAKRNL